MEEEAGVHAACGTGPVQTSGLPHTKHVAVDQGAEKCKFTVGNLSTSGREDMKILP
jgi:hypothetical protein